MSRDRLDNKVDRIERMDKMNASIDTRIKLNSYQNGIDYANSSLANSLVKDKEIRLLKFAASLGNGNYSKGIMSVVRPTKAVYLIG